MAERIEREFVNAYIARNRRSRVLFELQRPEKRQGLLFRIGRTIDPRYITPIDEKFAGTEEAARYMEKFGVSPVCYLLANPAYLPLAQAADRWLFGWPVFLLAPRTGTAFFEDEAYSAPGRPNIPRRFLLSHTAAWTPKP